MGRIVKTEACRRAWATLPEGAYTAQQVADSANALGLSDFCYAIDARNALRKLGVPAEYKHGADVCMKFTKVNPPSAKGENND